MADEQTAWQEGPSQAPVSGLQQETTGEATGEPPSLRQSGSSHLTSFVPVANNSLKVSVASPQKHGEGSGAFVTYLVSFSTVLDAFSIPSGTVRRRFQDFSWLSKCLGEEYPACILPPLPDKHRMEYLTGDRFSSEFIEKRQNALQSYLRHVARHPLLQKSVALRRFLEAGEVQPSEQMAAHMVKPKESRVFDNIGDAILSAFTKVRKPDPKFSEMKQKADKLEENLSGIEKLHSKTVKIESELGDKLKLVGAATVSMSNMETQMMSPLSALGTRLENYADFLKTKATTEDLDYLIFVREYIGYCESVKDLLKARDQKQIDHEELSAWFTSYTTERDRTAGGKAAGGITGFFKDKINDFKGVDPEKARQERVAKLNAKVHELEAAVEQSARDAQAFSDQVEKEIEIFETLKIQDFKEYLRNIADLQVDFHEKGFKFWDSMIPILADIGEDMGPLTEGELPMMPPPIAPTGTESVSLDLQETSLE